MDDRNSGAKRAGSALYITVIIAVSKIVGMAREMIFSYTFGQTLETSAYNTAFKLLNYITLIFSVGIASTFIPIYTKTRISSGLKKANIYANHILNLYIVVGILAGAVVYVAAPTISSLLWSGEESAAIAVPMVAEYTRLMLPTTVFWAITGVFCNILNANERFAPEQLMGFALSIMVVSACLMKASMRTVSLMTGLAGVLQVLILLPFLRGYFKYYPRMGLKSEKVHRTFSIALPAVVSMGFDEINSIADTYFATGISDPAVTQLANSYRLVTLVIGILVVPLTTITFPHLSQSAARGDKRGIIASIKQCTEILAIVIFPVTALIVLFPTEIVGIVYERGNFTPDGTIAVAMALVPYIIGVFGFSLRNFQTRVFYAMQQTKPPMIIGLGAVSLNVVMSAFVYKKMGLPGLTMATSIAGTVSAIAMLIVLRNRLGKMQIKSTIGQLFRIAIATAICFGVAWWCREHFPYQDATFSHRFIRLFVCGITGLIAYFAAVQILRVKEISRLADMLKTKLRKR